MLIDSARIHQESAEESFFRALFFRRATADRNNAATVVIAARRASRVGEFHFAAIRAFNECGSNGFVVGAALCAA
jgi:hypothetical protein